MNGLKCFISSTCIDLLQVRSDIEEYLHKIDYLPILSNVDTFPIDPEIDTISNCLRNIESSDIFILVIGNRYGYITEEGISITNTEYLYAKRIGRPIYIFINKAVLNHYDSWIANKTNDYSSYIDNIKLFEFIEEVRSKDKKWCFSYDKAQDIKSTLSVQFSSLFKESLNNSNKYKVNEDHQLFSKISASAIDIVLNKEDSYEPLFFAQILKDELAKFEDQKRDLEFNIIYDCKIIIEDQSEILKWLRVQFSKLTILMDTINNLFSSAYVKYYGEPGKPSDLPGLLYVASSIAKVFAELIKWSLETRSIKVAEHYQNTITILSHLVVKPISNIWDYGQTLRLEMESRIDEEKKTGQAQKFVKVLEFEMDRKIYSDFLNQLEKLTQTISLQSK